MLRHVCAALAAALASATLLLAAPAGAQDVCTFPGVTANWTAICTLSTGSFSCSGGDNTCDDGDKFLVSNASSEITATGTLTSTATALSGAAWLRCTGGSLTFADDLIMTMGDMAAAGVESLLIDDGCTFETQGTFFDYGATTSSADYSNTDYYQAGTVIAAPGECDDGGGGTVTEPDVGGDCAGAGETAGDANTTRFSYADSIYNASTDGDLATGFGALVNNQTIAYFFDPDLTDTYVPSQSNVPYIVTGSSTSDPYYFEIDMRQCSTADCDDPTEFPLADRAWKECILNAAASQGNRTVTVDNGCISADGDYEGQWIYFSANDEPCDDGDTTACSLEQRPYFILRTEANTTNPDDITLLDRRGVHADFAVNGPVWISPGGFQGGANGDPVAFGMWPTLRCAVATSADHDQCPVDYDTDYIIHGIVYDGTGRVTNDTGFACNSTEEYAWHRDSGSNAFVQRTYQHSCDHTVSHYAQSGANANDPDDCITIEGVGADGTLRVEDSSFRHCDFGVGGASDNNLSVTRTAIEWSLAGAIDGSGQEMDVTLRDVYIVAPALGGGNDSLDAQAVLYDVTNTAILASPRRVQDNAATTDNRYTNLFVAGMDHTSAGVRDFLEGTTINGLVYRDNISTVANARLVESFGVLENVRGIHIRKALIRDSTFNGLPFLFEGDHLWEDSIVYNIDTSTSSGMISFGGDTAPLRMLRLGFFNTLASHGFSAIININGVDADNRDEVTVDGFFGSGYSGATVLNGPEWDLIATCQNVALWNNGTDASATGLSGCSPQQDRPPGIIDFFDARQLNAFGGSPADQVNASVLVRAGISEIIWPMSRAKIPPETAGIVTGGGGGRGPRSY